MDTKTSHTPAALAAIGFLAAILAANYATSHYGLIPMGFGLMATAGTYFAGATFVLRDAVDDFAGRRAVVVLILAGAVLSFGLADGRIALASAVAFLLSELADFAVYRPLRRSGYVRAAIASNVVGTVVDSLLFLTIAGFPIQQAVAGQIVGKLTVTAVVVVAVAVVRTGMARKSEV